jgi:hypothetical protein
MEGSADWGRSYRAKLQQAYRALLVVLLQPLLPEEVRLLPNRESGYTVPSITVWFHGNKLMGT